MTAPLLSELAALGVVLSRSPAGRLRYRAKGELPAALLERLRLHRDELLAELTQGGDPTPPASTPATRPGSEETPATPPPAPTPATSESDADPDVGAQVLAALAEADVRVTLFDDGSLGWDAPPDYMTPQLRAAIAEAAPEIRAELRRCGRKAIPRWICLAELDPARYARPSPPPPSAPPSTPHRRAAAVPTRSRSCT